jgi:glycosyltransferase involved in cell wall biosynthesis
MALETPIVASDLPPVREVVASEGSATLVRPEDPGALSEAVVGVLTDRDRAAGLARRARERFLDAFTVDAVADEMDAFYRRALAAA